MPALSTDPHPLAHQLLRDRVDRVPDRHGRWRSTLRVCPKHSVCGNRGSRCMMLMLLREQVHRRPASRAVRPGVDIGHELLARRFSDCQSGYSRGGCDRSGPDPPSRSSPSPHCHPWSAGPPARTSESSTLQRRETSTIVALRTAIPHTCSTVTVFSLSVFCARPGYVAAVDEFRNYGDRHACRAAVGHITLGARLRVAPLPISRTETDRVRRRLGYVGLSVVDVAVLKSVSVSMSVSSTTRRRGQPRPFGP